MALAQLGRSERLRHEVIGSTLRCLLRNLGLGVGGEDEDLDAAGVLGRTKVAEHFPPVHPGEPDVEDDHVGQCAAGDVQTLDPVGGCGHLNIQDAQADFNQSPHAGGVFDHENPWLHNLHYRRRARILHPF